ncbi:hypothetical protein H2198_009153 [Neophaeococcomyces mojaviensis]|uniref:Uncharacterized protein n=1 Tax=Neophaeococcomyces mojaviensis TaxID=3383035 RepID=A0ACC2ZVB5_9EURO|nr:hypothetical protein H2198_009153 [Knufia sp. JES_112]
MKSTLHLLTVYFCIASTLALTHQKRQNATTTGPSYLILDNDWGPADFTQILMTLASTSYTLLGLTSNTANTWSLQTALHAVRSLQLGNLTNCIPVHQGASYPLLTTPSTFQLWQSLHGPLPYAGVMAPQNLTAQGLGSDPTSGDPNTINPTAFVGGMAPNTSLLASRDAAYFMIDSVRKHPGQVTIYAGGALTNIALAIRLDPNFARNAKQLVVMGGYIDRTLYQATGTLLEADINSDINLKIDPEASKIALTADWPNITLVGNAANSVFLNASDYAEISSVNNSFTEAFVARYFPVLPLWDVTALAVLLEPSIVTNSTEFFVDVDVSWYSPYYGEIRAYQEALLAMGQTLRSVRYPYSVDVERIKTMVKQAIMRPGSCADV